MSKKKNKASGMDPEYDDEGYAEDFDGDSKSLNKTKLKEEKDFRRLRKEKNRFVGD